MSGKSTVVGALACQRDSFKFNDFKTAVVSCYEQSKKPASKKKGKAAEEVELPVYLIELKDSILFPEGGGQPSDTGILSYEVNDETIEVPVFYVSRDGLYAKHHVNQPIEVGTQVTIEVNKDRRLDLMQQHTGQHLLSAILEQKYRLETVSWSMSVPTDIDSDGDLNDYLNFVELTRKLTEKEIDYLNDEINQYIILIPQPIKVEETKLKELDSSSKIPDDYDFANGGIVRTIHIGSLDSNQCCGTHLSNTSQLGSIMVIKSQTTVRSINSRLYFTCGSRVYKYGSEANNLLTVTKQILSSSDTQIPEKTQQLSSQLSNKSKSERYWMMETAVNDSNEIMAKFQNGSLSSSGINNISLFREDYCTQEYLSRIHKELTNRLLKDKTSYVIVIGGFDKKTQVASLMVLSDSGDTIQETVNIFNEALPNIKGGGGSKGGKWQGKATNISVNNWKSLTESFIQE
ncbi:similar to Saccharomyces cerevisiae YNL040W Putative protein of unknown function with strong similarity to alanyl-tRNA synthases from Eubacteria [Maudiozyma barnettii]|uniref:Threonyl/alanyl tRNA synthetase SAD domain-containing protein n=1 Tax=Maudiozyma barnettii TaxID=61262 RepID=A0A8H2VHL7_9SACH|nr:putative alanine--tRNA ligase [Kazachstania barnettii]CAB4255591.1 similar to Saccharomyces cerevisiae YNL040W Putative protein of unknown function with strong similarity to alanyl-tRNA synthases from Eubacteria [Kazachstania barnettii]CAD1784089.1 similar to Saccharomyces cerevisiae YNL040W Putative protein of unknown function with strong similarity to alanyl-tRNA synthases from Eubacteria [Kazachstania barnettii]